MAVKIRALGKQTTTATSLDRVGRLDVTSIHVAGHLISSNTFVSAEQLCPQRVTYGFKKTLQIWVACLHYGNVSATRGPSQLATNTRRFAGLTVRHWLLEKQQYINDLWYTTFKPIFSAALSRITKSPMRRNQIRWRHDVHMSYY